MMFSQMEQNKENYNPLKKLKVKVEEPYHLKHIGSKRLPSEGLTLEYDTVNEHLAIGCRNGDRLLYSIASNKIVQKYYNLSETPVTSVKWKPSTDTRKKTLVTGDGDGNLNYWNSTSLKKLFSLKEENNSIHSIDFNPQGTTFATGGKDANIRVYQQETKKVATLLQRASWHSVGHHNRLYAVKYADDNTLISGGWDSVVHIWDIRQGKSVRKLSGPNVSGESIDYQNGHILVGCNDVNNQIQLWDSGTATKIHQIDWTDGNNDHSAYLYTAAYSHFYPAIFAAGSTGHDIQVRIYKENQGSKPRLLGQISDFPEGCFALTFNPKNGQLAFTTAANTLFIYELTKS